MNLCERVNALWFLPPSPLRGTPSRGRWQFEKLLFKKLERPSLYKTHKRFVFKFLGV